jgi:hypothetical protein
MGVGRPEDFACQAVAVPPPKELPVDLSLGERGVRPEDARSGDCLHVCVERCKEGPPVVGRAQTPDPGELVECFTRRVSRVRHRSHDLERTARVRQRRLNARNGTSNSPSA